MSDLIRRFPPPPLIPTPCSPPKGISDITETRRPERRPAEPTLLITADIAEHDRNFGLRLRTLRNNIQIYREPEIINQRHNYLGFVMVPFLNLR